MDKAAVRQMGALTLAYIGDSVYDIYVRRDLIEKAPNMPAHGLHRQASRIVCAAGQARAAHHILDRLTEEEEQVLIMRRRGKSVVQVADALNMSAESVYRRERSIRSKLL